MENKRPLDFREIAEEAFKEGIQVQDKITGADSEEDMVRRIKKREQAGRTYYDELNTRTELNRRYWTNETVDEQTLGIGEYPMSNNRIFMALETIIPIVTRRTPEPQATVLPRSNSSLMLQEKVERYLKDQWDIENKMQQQLHIGIRHLAQSGYLIGKTYWDAESKTSKHKILSPGASMFPKGFSSVATSPWVIEYVRDTIENVYERFPEYQSKLEKYIAQKYPGADIDSRMTYVEYWEDGKVCWKFEDCYLGTADNPHYIYLDDKEEQRRINHFSSPRKPFMQCNWFTLGENIADETTLFDQVRELQDAVNRRKRQIDTNTEFANGKWIGAGGLIERDDFFQIEGDSHHIYLEKAQDVRGAIDVFYGRGLDQGVFADLQDTKRDMDNIMGTNATTRGERDAQETATGRAILKESDTGRLDLLTLNLEQYAEDYFNYEVQMVKTYFDEKHPIHSLPEGADPYRMSEQDKVTYISKEEFTKVSTKILVKNGSTAPRDRLVEASEAVQLARDGLMAYVDMYEALGYSNPEKMAKNAILQASSPEKLHPELVDPEKFEPEAIAHIVEVLSSTINPLPVPDPFDSADLRSYEKHIQTHRDYMAGIDIDEDVIPWEEISLEAKTALQQHVRNEIINLENLMAEQEAMADPAAMAAITPDQAAQAPAPEEDLVAAVLGGAV